MLFAHQYRCLALDLTINTIDVSVTNNDPSLTANAAGAAYQWLDCSSNYSVINGATDQTFMAAYNSQFAVAITQNGCTDTSACQTVLAIGIWERPASLQLRLYPNPSHGMLQLELPPVLSTAVVRVYTSVGRLVHQQLVTTPHAQLHLEGLPAGSYTVQVVAGSAVANRQVILMD